jgi:hypothetical protein
VFQDRCPHLSYLVPLRFAPLALKIDSLLDTRFAENVVTSLRTLLEAEVPKQSTKLVETDIRV